MTGFVCTFLEAAKVGVTPGELRSTLQWDWSFSDSRAGILCQVYGRYRASLREELARSARHSHVPRLGQVSVQTDYLWTEGARGL